MPILRRSLRRPKHRGTPHLRCNKGLRNRRRRRVRKREAGCLRPHKARPPSPDRARHRRLRNRGRQREVQGELFRRLPQWPPAHRIRATRLGSIPPGLRLRRLRPRELRPRGLRTRELRARRQAGLNQVIRRRIRLRQINRRLDRVKRQRLARRTRSSRLQRPRIPLSRELQVLPIRQRQGRVRLRRMESLRSGPLPPRKKPRERALD